MSGTALYRALVHAGAPEAADSIKDKNKSIDERLNRLDIMVAEIRVTNRILIVLVLATLIKSFF